MTPLTILGWLWRDPRGGARMRYTPERVNAWARMIRRHSNLELRFLVLTDNMNDQFEPYIEKAPLWKEYHLLENSLWQGVELPHCYVRLQAFSRDPSVRELLGPRFVSIDLDCLVTGSLDRILSRTENFVIWKRPKIEKGDYEGAYNASIWMMDTGALPQVWEKFTGHESIVKMQNRMNHDAVKQRVYSMTDQGWMEYMLGPSMPHWTGERDGIYMWRHLTRNNRWPLPDNCKIIFFNGSFKPWYFGELARMYG